MKTIGLLGGMSWESTVPYYQTINRVVRERLGGLHSARIVLYSVDFHEIERLQHESRWAEAAEILLDAARLVEGAGADFLVLCTNTMHKVAPSIEAGIGIPLLHIADATGTRIAAAGFGTIGLLGTRFTMEESFYRDRLEHGHGLTVLTPSPDEREAVHRVIYDELCLGTIRVASRSRYRGIVEGLVARGAQAIVLGCTEIGLLLRPADVSVPLFDTAKIHAEEAALRAVEREFDE